MCQACYGLADAGNAGTPSASSMALEASLEKLGKKYGSFPKKGAALYPTAPVTANITSEEKTRPSTRPSTSSSAAPEVALAKLQSKFKGNVKREERQSELNENQKGM
ncbi:MAG: hypothetical protein PHU34_09335 [Candidatus Methanoperedens sp.]|nr:hypothetical protein [Candidatus Methanoperedens sp.]